jgi:hypothetical protein
MNARLADISVSNALKKGKGTALLKGLSRTAIIVGSHASSVSVRAKFLSRFRVLLPVAVNVERMFEIF